MEKWSGMRTREWLHPGCVCRINNSLVSAAAGWSQQQQVQEWHDYINRLVYSTGILGTRAFLGLTVGQLVPLGDFMRLHVPVCCRAVGDAAGIPSFEELFGTPEYYRRVFRAQRVIGFPG